VKLSQISLENVMGDAILGQAGPSNKLGVQDLQQPKSAEPEKDFVHSGSGAGPKKKRHRRFMRLDTPEPGI
jgi:hypothetical protein